MVAANAVTSRRRWALGLTVAGLLGALVARRVSAQAPHGEESQSVVLAGVVSEGAAVEDEAGESEPPTYESRSVGVPDRGQLLDGVELQDGPYLFVRETRRGRATWGTGELVGLIQRAAAQVAAAHPGPKLVVGDLSRRRGGRLSPHRSHRNGRDADIGFYLLNEAGEPVEPPRFVHVGRRGCGRIGRDRYCFDVERNWTLLTALVSDPIARIQYVLVAPYIRRRLLAEGERRGASEALMARVRTVTAPHRGSSAHRSHFHVRIYCPVDDRPGCVDEPPYHEWYVGEPSRPPATIRRLRARQHRARRQAQDRAQRRAPLRRERAQQEERPQSP